MMLELFTTAFVTLVVIVDPPGCAPIFASLTSGTPQAHRRKMAVRSCLVAWSILIFFGLLWFAEARLPELPFGGVTPVRSVDGRPIGSAVPGAVTVRLSQLYDDTFLRA